MEIQFYDIRSRRKIGVPLPEVGKSRFEGPTRAGGTRPTYALRTTHEGPHLSKFCSRADWESLDVPQE